MTFLPMLARLHVEPGSFLIDGSWLLVALATLPAPWIWNKLGARMGDALALRLNYILKLLGVLAVLLLTRGLGCGALCCIGRWYVFRHGAVNPTLSTDFASTSGSTLICSSSCSLWLYSADRALADWTMVSRKRHLARCVLAGRGCLCCGGFAWALTVPEKVKE